MGISTGTFVSEMHESDRMDTMTTKDREVRLTFTVEGMITDPQPFIHIIEVPIFDPNDPRSTTRAGGSITLEGIDAIREVKDQLVKIVDMLDTLMNRTPVQPAWSPHPTHNAQGQLIRDARGNTFMGPAPSPNIRTPQSFNADTGLPDFHDPAESRRVDQDYTNEPLHPAYDPEQDNR
jgi:hypothetical protein